MKNVTGPPNHRGNFNKLKKANIYCHPGPDPGSAFKHLEAGGICIGLGYELRGCVGANNDLNHGGRKAQRDTEG